MTCAQSKSARAKARHDPRYASQRNRDAKAAARRLAKVISSEKARATRKGQKK